MSSIENINKLLNFEEGNYLICGRPVSGTSTLFKQLLIKMGDKKHNIFTSNLDNFIKTRNEKQYSVVNHSAVILNNNKNINIYILSEYMENENDIPNELKEDFLCIYSKYTYSDNPTKDNEKKANIKLETLTIEEIMAMVE